MRKIIVNIAASADGFISRPDGGIDWLDRPRIKGDYGLPAFMKSVDTILYGRKTYDTAMKYGGLGVFGPNITHFVFSKRARRPKPDVTFVKESIPAFCRKLRKKPGKNIWMMGGGQIIGAFLDAGEIDELMIHVIPVFIGEGIPLIAPRHCTIPLRLLKSRAFSDGVVGLHYAVEKAPKAKKRRKR